MVQAELQVQVVVREVVVPQAFQVHQELTAQVELQVQAVLVVLQELVVYRVVQVHQEQTAQVELQVLAAHQV
jgi:hypothetical protein